MFVKQLKLGNMGPKYTHKSGGNSLQKDSFSWSCLLLSSHQSLNCVGVSHGYTDHYQGRGQSSRLTATHINSGEPLI